MVLGKADDVLRSRVDESYMMTTLELFDLGQGGRQRKLDGR